MKTLSLADAILDENTEAVKAMLSHGVHVNVIDEYGFTPLIEAAIANRLDMATWLIQAGANPKQPDALGGTALHWAAENNNEDMARLFLKNGADPDACNLSGQPVLLMPLLRQQNGMKGLLLRHGASLEFAQDYMNTKLLGHIFELVGTASIIDPKNQFIEVDFEGFFLEVSLGLISDSLDQFKNHFAGRKLRQYIHYFQVVVDTLTRASQLIRYQQYQVDIKRHQDAIQPLIHEEPLVIPVGYEGHAITFIKFGNILVKCDRREDSRLFDPVLIYQMDRPEGCDMSFIQALMYEKQSDSFINDALPHFLALQPIAELNVHAQISGNCSWANVEACIPALFFLLFSGNENFSDEISHYKNLSLKFFNQWREWNKDRALQFCIQRFQQADSVRKACFAETLAAILFQACGGATPSDAERAESILQVIGTPEYEHLIKNYVKIYCYEDYSEEGQRFLRFLRDHGYRV
ncbi:MAG TPA: ankyrin repeat domain-containing protein [Gammaproteobacteria bacterium]|nr:ankyrin repeat domain-containing protein [Gammaproteobacteria bacterium]